MLLVLMALQAAWYWGRMPARIASHFDGPGHPNGWTTRAGMLGFTLFLVAVQGSAFFLLPKLLRFIPNWINIPNRGYWLAPERRAASLVALERWMNGLGAGIFALLLLANELVYRANLKPEPRLDRTAFLVLLGAFLLFFVHRIVAIHRLFPKPARS